MAHHRQGPGLQLTWVSDAPAAPAVNFQLNVQLNFQLSEVLALDWFFIFLDLTMSNVEEDTDAALPPCLWPRYGYVFHHCLHIARRETTTLVVASTAGRNNPPRASRWVDDPLLPEPRCAKSKNCNSPPRNRQNARNWEGLWQWGQVLSYRAAITCHDLGIQVNLFEHLWAASLSVFGFLFSKHYIDGLWFGYDSAMIRLWCVLVAEVARLEGPSHSSTRSISQAVGCPGQNFDKHQAE